MARVKLGEVACEYKATIKNGAGLPVVGLEHLTPGEIILENWDVDTENTFTKGFKKGHMLFGRRRAYLKKAALAPFDGICSGDITVIEAIPEKINPELLPFIIQNDLLFDFAVGNSAGSLSPRVKWDSLKEYEFELPELSKQDALVELLKAAHRTKTAYNQQIIATDELVKSQFIEMIAQSDCSNYLGDFIKRITPQRCGDRNLPVLSVTKEHALVFQDERFDSTVASKDKCNYLIAPRGIIVQGIHIDEANFGLQTLVDEGIVSPAYKLWAITSKDVVPEILEFYLRSDTAIDYYKRNFQGTTVARRQTLRAEDFLAMPLNLPKIDKQKWFLLLMQQSDKSKFELQEAIVRIDNFIKSLIQQDTE